MAVALLLLVLGSGGDVAVTDAVLVTVPRVGDLTTIVTVAELPLAMVPSEHITMDFEGFAVHEPVVVVADAKPAFFGS